MLPILCTGRSPYMLGMIERDHFAGTCTFNGALCVMSDGRELVRNPLDRDDVATILRQSVEERLYASIYMEEDRLYLTERNALVDELERPVGERYPIGDDPYRALDHDVFQINIFADSEGQRVASDVTRNLDYTRWTELFCDVIPKGGGKARAVSRVLELLGIDPGEAVAFGDGGNDLGMFGVVGTAVAMGNAAGEGACMVLKDRGAWAIASDLAKNTEFLELATLPDFQDEFIDALEFGIGENA